MMKLPDRLTPLLGSVLSWNRACRGDAAGLSVAALVLFSVVFTLLLQPVLGGPLLTVAAIVLGAATACGLGAFGDGKRADRDAQAARLCHDLRTQLGIIQLQLNAVPDPRARRVEEDVRELTAMVDRIGRSQRGES